MSSKVISAKAWADQENALRARYHDAGLYVRKQVYDKQGQTIVVGGWAFLDGEPAMIPVDLDILVVSTTTPSGAMETLGREPGAVLSLLAPYATRNADPIDHWAVRVPEADKSTMLDRIRALPEHTPGTGTAPTMAMPAAGFSSSAFSSSAPTTSAVRVPEASGGSSTGLWIAGAVAVAFVGVVGLVCVGGGLYVFSMRSASAPPIAGPTYPSPSYPSPSYPSPSYPPPSYPPPSYPPPAAMPAPDRYSVPAPAIAPSRGPTSAPLVIQIFSDFQCPFCSRVEPTVARILESYPTQVRVVWRNYPLTFHANAMPAAEAASEIFAQLGDAGFWPYHDLLFENQHELGVENLVVLASRVPGADVGRLGAALADHRHRPAIDADMAAVTAAGMSIGTPAFLIGDELVTGAQPFERFQTVIDAHLAGL